MSGFDPSKDVKSFEKETLVGDSALVVSVHSYSGGPKKLQVSRKTKNQDGILQFAKKTGRFTKEEVRALSGLLAEAYSGM